MGFYPIYPNLSLDVVSEDFALGYNQIGATTTTTAPRCVFSPSSQAIPYYNTAPTWHAYTINPSHTNPSSLDILAEILALFDVKSY